MPALPQTILVVEDEAAIAETIIYALQTEGFVPFWKPTGREALAALMFFTRKVDWFSQEERRS